MRNLMPVAVLAATLALVSAPGAPLPTQWKAQVRSDEALLAEFGARVQVYVDLHECLEGPPRKVGSRNWTEIYGAIQMLGAEIRAARRDARQGDVFTPEIELLFRRLTREALADVDPDELLLPLNEENPPGLVLTPEVNGRWPDEAALGSMPPKLLAALPLLPADLQYRFMDRDLILWDAHANVIVDFMKDVIPRRPQTRLT
jgi:hypothetical protein